MYWLILILSLSSSQTLPERFNDARRAEQRAEAEKKVEPIRCHHRCWAKTPNCECLPRCSKRLNILTGCRKTKAEPACCASLRECVKECDKESK